VLWGGGHRLAGLHVSMRVLDVVWRGSPYGASRRLLRSRRRVNLANDGTAPAVFVLRGGGYRFAGLHGSAGTWVVWRGSP